MEYNGSAWPKIQPPQPDPLLVHPHRTSLPPHPHHHHHYASAPYYYQDQTRPSTLSSSSVSSHPYYYHSPGADAATAASVYAPPVRYEGHALGPPTSQDPPPAPYEGYPTSVPYSYPSTVGAVGATDYYGVGAADTYSFSVKEAIQQYGTDPTTQTGIALPAQYELSNRLDGVVVAHLNRGQKTNRNQHFATKKRASGMGKNVRSAYCEVCKINCNSQEVLNSHKFGKKHKKNLEKLRESIALKPQNVVEPSAGCSKGDKKSSEINALSCCKSEQVSGTTEANRNNRKKKNAPATAEDLEIKKQKVLDGGAPADGVRVCTICNVVCNSELVFNYHIAGQKHAAMVKNQKNND